jgi:hypothetical protein
MLLDQEKTIQYLKKVAKLHETAADRELKRQAANDLYYGESDEVKKKDEIELYKHWSKQQFAEMLIAKIQMGEFDE